MRCARALRESDSHCARGPVMGIGRMSKGMPLPGIIPEGVRRGRRSSASMERMGVTPATGSRPNSQPYA